MIETKDKINFLQQKLNESLDLILIAKKIEEN